MISDALVTLAVFGAVVMFAVRAEASRRKRAAREREATIARTREELRRDLQQEANRGYSMQQALPELQEYVRIAARVLGSPVLMRLPVVKPPSLDGRRLDYVKRLVALVTERFGLPLPRVKVRFCQPSGSHAGSVRRRGDTWYIDLAESFADDDFALAAIIVHEFTHIVLGEARVSLAPSQRNEELTDATAVMAGFGPLLLHSAFREQLTEHEDRIEGHAQRLGYLPPAAIVFLLALQLEIAGTPANALRSKLDEWHHEALDEMQRLSAEWRRPVPRSLVESYQCFACGTRMRLPDVSATIRVRCPHCTLSQELVLKAGGATVSPNS